MKALDTFSGIGGFALGFERVGISTVAFCEKARYPRAVLARRWPGIPCFHDIHAIDADGLDRLGPIDIVSGGVPCQPASLAGSRRGRSDDRWLWPAFLDVVRLSRAPWVLAENPLGLISLKPDGLAWVCGALRELGYDAWPIVISAHDVGAPHLRKRVWIVAHSDSNQLWLDQQRAAGRWDHVQDRGHAEPRDHGAQEPLDHAHGARRAEPAALRARGGELREGEREGGAARGGGDALPDSDGGRCEIERIAQHAAEPGASGDILDGRGSSGWRDGATDPDAERQRLQGIIEARTAAQTVDRSRDGRDSARWWWLSEPDVGRVADGVFARVDRLRALGNACIPQIVEAFGVAILETDRAMKCAG